jgi:hypothetical protein
VSCGLIQAGSIVASVRQRLASGRATSSGTTRSLPPIDPARIYPFTCRMIFVQRSTIGSTVSAFSGGNIGTTPPSARGANLIAGDGTKNGFPAPNKEPPAKQKHDLTTKAPYRFESRLSSEESAANSVRT